MKFLKKLLIITLSTLLAMLTGCVQDQKLDLQSAEVKVRVLQSGKSDCIFVDLQGYKILIDCADEGDFPLIDSMLKDMGVDRLDLLIVTHFDNDHIGSAAEVIEEYGVGETVMPSYARHSKPMRNLLEAIEEKPDMKVLKLDKKDCKKTLENGVSIEINAPKDDYGVEDNPNSLITVITLEKGEKLLFTGDATKERLAEFFAENTNSFVFAKLPHHGGYNLEVKKLLTQKDLVYAAVTVESLDDADNKMLTLAKTTPIKTLFTCDGDIYLLYRDGVFEYYQV